MSSPSWLNRLELEESWQTGKALHYLNHALLMVYQQPP